MNSHRKRTIRGSGGYATSSLMSGCESHAAWSIGCTGRIEVLPRVKRGGLTTRSTVIAPQVAAKIAPAAHTTLFKNLTFMLCSLRN